MMELVYKHNSKVRSQIDIWQNGVKLLEHLDFSATGGTDVSFSHPAPSGSSIEYILNITVLAII